MPSLKNLIGQKFGYLTVIERGPDKVSGKRKIVTWKCICECGNIPLLCIKYNEYSEEKIITWVKEKINA